MYQIKSYTCSVKSTHYISIYIKKSLTVRNMILSIQENVTALPRNCQLIHAYNPVKRRIGCFVFQVFFSCTLFFFHNNLDILKSDYSFPYAFTSLSITSMSLYLKSSNCSSFVQLCYGGIYCIAFCITMKYTNIASIFEKMKTSPF